MPIKPSQVLFEDGKVVLMSASAQVLAEINLSDNEAKLSKTSSSLPVIYCKYSDDKFAGISGILDKSGNVKSIKLSMYDSNLKELSSVELDGALPDSFSNDTESKNVLFFDSQSGLIGIPAVSKSEYGFKNLYYLVSYGGDGLKLKESLSIMMSSKIQALIGQLFRVIFYMLFQTKELFPHSFRI